MAVGLRGLFKLNLGLAKTVFSKSNFINAGIRFMYTEADLGILTYENTRFIFRNQFISIEDTFRTKMKEICQSEDGIVFTEDLKAMIHLAQPTDEDMQLVTKMLIKFIKFKSEKQFATYVFGSVLMRMCYYLNQPKVALSLFNNPDLADTFAYHSAVRTLLCLLYKHQMYDEIKEVFETVTSRNGPQFSYNTSIIMYAACLKQNTPETAEYALAKWKDNCKIHTPSFRSTAIVAYLAIRHNAAQEALEMLSVVNRESTMTNRCLKLLAYTHLQKYLSVIPILKHSTEQEVLVPHRFGFYADVIYELEEKLQNETGYEKEQIMSYLQKLRQQQRIETDKTFEEFLLRPLPVARPAQTDSTQMTRRPITEHRAGLKSYL